MEAPLSFNAPLAHSRKAQVAAGASSTARLLKVATKVGPGCPSFGGQRTVASDREQEELELSKHLSLSVEVPSFESTSCHQPRKPGFFSQYPSTGSAQAQLNQLKARRWYASAYEYKARLQLTERGLTLPSSGPAFGRPLKSNVRAQKMPRYVIPPSSGPYEVLQSRAGTPLVANNYTGTRKVRVPCRTIEQARELCKQLNEGRHNGEVFV